MKIEELIIPEFIFGEIPIKTGSIHDQRMWIYCTRALSLIEVIAEDELTVAIDRKLLQKKYQHEDEQYTLVFIQNNCEATENDPNDLLDNAWHFIAQYFKWEDNQNSLNEN
jgi:hypothetical protein